MKTSRFIALLAAVILLFCGCGRSVVSTSGEDYEGGTEVGRETAGEAEMLAESFGSISGVWLNEKYIGNIRGGRFFPGDDISVYRIEFSGNMKDYFWEKSFRNERESGAFTGLRETGEDGRYALVTDDGADPGITVEIRSGKAGKVHCGAESFAKIESSEDDFINEAVLAGYYSDQDGRVYHFDEGRTARWSTGEFSYGFGDTFRADCNTITASNIRGSIDPHYGFEFVGSDLYLYRMDESNGRLLRSGSPISILRRFDPAAGSLLVDFEVQYIRLFESGDYIPDQQERVYLERFPASSTRYVNWEIGLSYSPMDIKRIMRVYHAFYSEDGRLYGEGYENETFYVDREWTSSNHTWGYGNAAGGTWPPGLYRVEVWINSQRAGSATFEIYDENARDIP